MVGQYKVEKRIAPESGQNNIYVVYDTQRKRQCAMKVRVIL